MADPVYRRVIVKLSGEALTGAKDSASTRRPSSGWPAI